jgi:RNA polymerase sigma-70 factor (ECF subfamily)
LNEFINHTESELLQGLRNGEKKSFEEIFNRYWLQLYRIAYSKLKSKNEAEELVQEIFFNLWQGHQTLLIHDLSHYLKASVKLRVISRIRSKIVREKYWTYYQQFIPGYRSLTDESVEYRDLYGAFEKAMSQLPQKSQIVFKLNRIQGLSIDEISDQLKIPRRTIEHHLTKSTRSLKVLLKDFILSLLLFSFVDF